jgi:hypothetical protein
MTAPADVNLDHRLRNAKARADQLQRRVYELEAERDRLRAALEAVAADSCGYDGPRIALAALDREAQQ